MKGREGTRNMHFPDFWMITQIGVNLFEIVPQGDIPQKNSWN